MYLTKQKVSTIIIYEREETMDTIIDIDIPKDIHRVEGPKQLVEKLTSIIGFKPDSESIVIINTNMDDDYVVSCKVIPTLDLYNIFDHIDDIGNNVGTILCYYTNQKLNKVRPSAERLFDYLNDVINIRDILFIRHNRWGSFICFDDLCCPPNGRIF